MSMTHYVVIGISYQQSTVAHREKLSFSPEEAERFLANVISAKDVQECALLSTCNRTEIYLVSENPSAALSHLLQSLKQSKGEAAPALFAEGYQYHNRNCVQHLFRVAAGLESQLLGETQILHQVKNAHQLAAATGASGSFCIACSIWRCRPANACATKPPSASALFPSARQPSSWCGGSCRREKVPPSFCSAPVKWLSKRRCI
jgi:hypothetical protein